MYYLGIDSGSTNCKIVLFKDDVIETLAIESCSNPQTSARKGVDYLVGKYQLKDGEYCVIVTGYGREIIDFAKYSLTEISTHALGGLYLKQEVNGIIDIGGQDCKVIELAHNRVINFLMNDKCAAGTGSFLKMICQKLELEMNEIDEFITCAEYVNIVSMCAVFAESEIVGLLTTNTKRSEILLGVIVSIAQRIKQMVAKVGFNTEDTLLLTGGLAQSTVIRQTLERETGLKIINHDYSLYAGAIGAAIHGKNKNEGMIK